VHPAAGGFFTDAPDSDYALAITDGAFTKALVIQLARKVHQLRICQPWAKMGRRCHVHMGATASRSVKW
jgi:hypothetical protein